jgi:hypothetical protein
MNKKNTSNETLISNCELADFLIKSADFYNSGLCANRKLSNSLKKLAVMVRDGNFPQKNYSESKPENKSSIIGEEELRSLTLDEVQNIINDKSKKKEELIRVANLRFSMPISQLKKIKIDEVVEKINSSILHERSIAIISEAADRDGESRTS